MKSLFENDLIAGMQQELRKQASETDPPDLARAGECLHAALEILEEAGLQARANQVLGILAKIANNPPQKTHKLQGLPGLHTLMQHGITQKDLQEFQKGNPVAKAKMNLALYSMGFDGHQIARFLGPDNVLTHSEARDLANPNRGFGKMWEWMQNPKQPDLPGDTLTMTPTQDAGPMAPMPSQLEGEQVEDPSVPADLKFKSIATGKPGKGDRHTRKLTPDKMIANLKDHGTVFNMADDGSAIDINNSDFDPEIAEILGTQNADDPSLDWDLNLATDFLEASDPQPLEDFEDEVSHADDKKEDEEPEKSPREAGSMRCSGCGKRMALCDCIKAFPQKRIKR